MIPLKIKTRRKAAEYLRDQISGALRDEGRDGWARIRLVTLVRSLREVEAQECPDVFTCWDAFALWDRELQRSETTGETVARWERTRIWHGSTSVHEPGQGRHPRAIPGTTAPCCEHGRETFCVCGGAYVCPEHGGRCFGRWSHS